MKQGDNEQVSFYLERTEKVKSRFHVVLSKDEDKVESRMVGIREMLTKYFVRRLRPKI